MEMIVFKRNGGKMLSYTYEIPSENRQLDAEIFWTKKRDKITVMAYTKPQLRERLKGKKKKPKGK